MSDILIYLYLFIHLFIYLCIPVYIGAANLASLLGRNPDWQIDSITKKLIVSVTDDNSNKEREVQDLGDEDVMHEPLLD